MRPGQSSTLPLIFPAFHATVFATLNHRLIPKYRFIKGHAILIALTSLGFILTVAMTLFLRRENSRRDLLLSEQNLTLESITDEIKLSQRERGDDATFFRYTV